MPGMTKEDHHYLLQRTMVRFMTPNDGRRKSNLCHSILDKLIAEYLIKKGANVNLPNKVELSPLHFAAENDNLQTAKLLIENGANVNAVSKFGWTPLHKCAAFGKYYSDECNLKLDITQFYCSEDPDRHRSGSLFYLNEICN